MGWLPNVESCRTDVPGRAAVSPPRKWSVQPFPHQNRLVVFGVSASDACCLNECCSCVGGHWWTSSTPHSLCIRQTDFSSEIYRYLAAVGMWHRWQSRTPLSPAQSAHQEQLSAHRSRNQALVTAGQFMSLGPSDEIDEKTVARCNDRGDAHRQKVIADR